jgi:hypothetical protein
VVWIAICDSYPITRGCRPALTAPSLHGHGAGQNRSVLRTVVFIIACMTPPAAAAPPLVLSKLCGCRFPGWLAVFPSYPSAFFVHEMIVYVRPFRERKLHATMT